MARRASNQSHSIWLDSNQSHSIGKHTDSRRAGEQALGADPNFLLGRWIQRARDMADGPEQGGAKDLFEFNARNQVLVRDAPIAR